MKTVFAKGLAVMALSAACGAALADPVSYSATLSGGAEATPNDSPAFGAVILTYDVDAHSLQIQSIFAGLLANATAAHIHCCTMDPGDGTAGVATMTPTFDGFPTDTSGTYFHTFDTSQASFWNASFISANGGTTAGAEAALLAGLNSGSAYLNIHSSLYPGGEIRGFLAAPAPVPEPAMAGMLLLGIPAIVALGRRRGKQPGQEGHGQPPAPAAA